MKTVTFAADYRHPKPPLSEVHYLAGKTYEVSDEVAQAAEKADKLEKKNGRRSDDRTAKGGADAASE